MNRRKRKTPELAAGFSLVELLIVIAVIVILIALLLPAIGAARAKSRQAQCASNQHQIWLVWNRALANLGAVPSSQWPDKLKGLIDNGVKVYSCPDDVRSVSSEYQVSYALNDHAARMGGKDSGKIVFLDYNQFSVLAQAVDIKVVGQTYNTVDTQWRNYLAPRHFQSLNVAFFDGHVEPKAADPIDPRICVYYRQFWRPTVDGMFELANCQTPGASLPQATGGSSALSTTGSSGSSVSSGSSGATSSTGTTSTTPSTTGSSTTTGGTTGSTTGSTTTGGTTTGGTTTTTGGSTTGAPCSPLGVGNVPGGLLAFYKFDVVGLPGLDSSGTGHDAMSFDPDKVTVVDDPQRCKVGWFRGESEVGHSGLSFRIGEPGGQRILNNAPEWCIMYWYKFDNTQATKVLTGKGACSPYGSLYHLLEHGSDGGAHVQWCIAAWIGMAYTPPRNQWSHFACALSTTTDKLYTWLNGVPNVANDARHYSQSLRMVLLNSYEEPDGVVSSNNAKTGHFDNLRIYNRIPADAEVQSIYNSERGP